MCEIPELKPFELYIGTDEAKNAVVYPLNQLPHLLVCGMNGCGRSSFLRTQTALLAHGTSAEQLRQDFTPAAKKMSDSLGVQLWGRSKLDALLRVYESPEQQIMRMLLKALKGILKFAAYIMGFLMALMFIPFWFLWPSKKRRR